MKQVKIQYHEYWFFLILAFFPIGIGIWGISEGEPFLLTATIIAMGLGLCILFSIQAMATDSFSAEGITMKRASGTRTIPWNDVIQVGIRFVGKGRKEYVFAFAGSEPKKNGEDPSFWLMRNRKTTLCVSYSQALEEVVHLYYGSPDFKGVRE